MVIAVPLVVVPLAFAGGLGLLDLSFWPQALKAIIHTAANISTDFI